MQILIVSEDHLGLNSEVSKKVLDAPYFTVVNYQDEKIKNIKNLENEHETMEVQEFINLLEKFDISVLIYNKIDDELEKKLKEKDLRIFSGEKGRIADIINKIDF